MEHAHHPIHTPIVTVSNSEEHQPLLHQMTMQSALSSTHGHPLPPPSHGLQAPSGTLPSPQLQSKRVVLNVGGVRHEVMWKTLDRLPHTRLGKLSQCTTHEALMELCDDYNTAEFFFDRQPRSFSSILNFYQTGRLHLAEDVCVLSLGEDIQYWNIDEQYLDLCCQNKYHHRKDRVLEELRKDAKIAVEDFGSGGCAKWRQKLWNLLEKPHTSTVALLLTILSVVFVVLSTVSMMASTLPSFQGYDQNGNLVENQIFLIIDAVFIVWFTFGWILRLWTSPSKVSFFKDPVNIIDLVANASYYIRLSLFMIVGGTEIFDMLESRLKFLQICRIIRLLKLARYSTVSRSLGRALKRSWKELSLIVMSMAIAVVVFSSLVFFVEKDAEHDYNSFSSIPNALWWTVVTMTTVGYGDMLPHTSWGRLVAAACCVCGTLFIVLPVPILVSSFNECYREQLRREKAEKRRANLLLLVNWYTSGNVACLSVVNNQDVNWCGTVDVGGGGISVGGGGGVSDCGGVSGVGAGGCVGGDVGSGGGGGVCGGGGGCGGGSGGKDPAPG